MGTQQFEAARQSAGAARQFVRAELAQAPCDTETAALLVSELATNAIGHGGSAFEVSVQVAPAIRVAVHDHDPTPVFATCPEADAEHGRGLFLVETLASQWGVELDDDGKTVWFEL